MAGADHQAAGQRVNAVTSDILPTVCELAGLSLPDRPLDGISLTSLLDGKMSERPRPIPFWTVVARQDPAAKPYISIPNSRKEPRPW